MILEDARNYTFMTKGAVRVPGIEDVEEFQMTQNAMKVMGISDEDMGSIWRVISASLLFGNMEFKQERNSDQATLPDNTVAQKASFSIFKVREGVRNFSLKSLGLLTPTHPQFSSKSKNFFSDPFL